MIDLTQHLPLIRELLTRSLHGGIAIKVVRKIYRTLQSGGTLSISHNTTLTNQVHNGTVLFYASPGVAFPATVGIMNAAGDSLAEYGELNNFAYHPGS